MQCSMARHQNSLICDKSSTSVFSTVMQAHASCGCYGSYCKMLSYREQDLCCRAAIRMQYCTANARSKLPAVGTGAECAGGKDEIL